MIEPKLLKTDKNGTKYWRIIEPCHRCGGAGNYGDYGVCYRCGGHNSMTFEQHIEKEYTPEYAAKLEAAREKRHKAKVAEDIKKAQENGAVAKAFKAQGANENGICWVAVGDTYLVKDEIKSEGGVWNACLRHWVYDHKPERRCVEVDLDKWMWRDYRGVPQDFEYRECYGDSDDEKSIWGMLCAEDKKAKKEEANIPDEYVFSEGEKIDVTVKFHDVFASETDFGTRHTCIFKDDAGHVLVWRTGFTDQYYNLPETGEMVHIKATVKELSDGEYGKNHIITRVKVVEDKE